MDVNNDIGSLLRGERESREVTGRELARRIKRSQSYISKIESGALRPNEGYIRDLAGALVLPARRLRQILALYHLYEVEHNPLPDRPRALSERQKHIDEIESTAKTIRSFGLSLVPGLVQVESYMREIFSGVRVIHRRSSEADIERAVEKRVQRQRSLKSAGKKIKVLLVEGVLHMHVVSREALVDQLRGLKEVVEREASRCSCELKLSCIPFASQFSLAPAANFGVYDDNLVVVDTLDGFITIRHPQDVQRYIKAFEGWSELAMSDDEFIQRIDRRRQELLDNVEENLVQT